MSEIKIIEPKTKIWYGRERTVQTEEFEPDKIIVGLSEAFDENITPEDKKAKLKALADAVEEELRIRLAPLLRGTSKAPVTPQKVLSTPPKTPSKAPDVKDYPEYKICANCGESVQRMESKFKRDDGKPFYYRCPACKSYKME
jgi:DNA-directed RNA polymerase subunit RPC12/RpoP